MKSQTRWLCRPLRRAGIALVMTVGSGVAAAGVLFATGDPSASVPLADRSTGRGSAPTHQSLAKPPPAVANDIAAAPPRGNRLVSAPVEVTGTPLTPERPRARKLTIPGQQLRALAPRTRCTGLGELLGGLGALDPGLSWLGLTVRAPDRPVALRIEGIQVRRLRVLPTSGHPNVVCVPSGTLGPPLTLPPVIIDRGPVVKSVPIEVYGGNVERRLAPGQALTHQLYVGATNGRYEYDLVVRLTVDGKSTSVTVRDGSRPFTVYGGRSSARELRVWCEDLLTRLINAERPLRAAPGSPCRSNLLDGVGKAKRTGH